MVPRYETVDPLVPPPNLGPYRDADYTALPDEPRCELLFGRLRVTPAPSLRHGQVVAALAAVLSRFAETAGGLVAVAPVDVVLFEHSVVQPDLVWLAEEHLDRCRNRLEGAPDLAVEVLSPSTERRDRGEKLRLYAEAGVPEYWIVDGEREIVEFLVLGAEDATGVRRFEVHMPQKGIYQSTRHPGLTLDLASFWRRLTPKGRI